MRTRKKSAEDFPMTAKAMAAAQEKAEKAIRHSWAGMHTNARRADADEATDQVAAGDCTSFADTVVAEPTVCQGVLCPEKSGACANCELRLEEVLFH